MDRRTIQRGLVVLSGIALLTAATGCRNRNLRVPPQPHYTDGSAAAPAAAPYNQSGLDPYGQVNNGSAAADPYAGYDQPAGAAYGAEGAQGYAAAAGAGADGAYNYGTPYAQGGGSANAAAYGGGGAIGATADPAASGAYSGGQGAAGYGAAESFDPYGVASGGSDVQAPQGYESMAPVDEIPSPSASASGAYGGGQEAPAIPSPEDMPDLGGSFN